ncbi:hypothetical protein KFU94_13490 [Chloroflexi bacterium TSY]|nr:hypothetical protein [Chloroflexi bacterium TSY]
MVQIGERQSKNEAKQERKKGARDRAVWRWGEFRTAGVPPISTLSAAAEGNERSKVAVAVRSSRWVQIHLYSQQRKDDKEANG